MIEWTSTGPIYTGVGGIDPMFMPGYQAPGYRMNPMTGMSPINQMHQQMAQQTYQQQMQNQHYSSNVARDELGLVLPKPGKDYPGRLSNFPPQNLPGLNQPAPFPMNRPQVQTSFSQFRSPPRVANYGPVDLDKMSNFIPTDPMNYQSNTPFGPSIPQVPISTGSQSTMKPPQRQHPLRPPIGSWEEKIYKMLGI